MTADVGLAGGDARLVLRGEGLRCVRDVRLVFDELGFEVGSGEALVVTGPNGAGKSSLLRIVAGLLAPTGGRLMLTGGVGEETVGEQAHYLGHKDAVKPSLSVLENLAFWVRFFRRTGAAKAVDATLSALTEVGLDSVADLPGGYLSAGQQRRLAIARLIAVPRRIWLLDEPTTSLDVAFQARFTTIMSMHLDRGGLILAATHAPLGLDAAGELRLGAAA